MWNTKKSVAAIFSAMALTLASMGNAIPVFAEEAETTAITGMADDSSAANMELDEEDMQKLVDEIQHNKAAMENSDDETDNAGHDYYADENYDTDGNATLIKHEKIIYDSEKKCSLLPSLPKTAMCSTSSSTILRRVMRTMYSF